MAQVKALMEVVVQRLATLPCADEKKIGIVPGAEQAKRYNLSKQVSEIHYTKNDDGTASVYPVDLSGAPGSISVELVMKKEGDVWRIVTVNPDGM